jgi:predicted glycosyltransferase
MLPSGVNLTSLVIGGPELPADKKPALLQQIAETPRTHWLDYTDDLASYMVAANAVVSMGGYNTVCEILSLGKRAVIVPRTQPVEEQWIRAKRMAEMGLFQTIHPDRLTAEGLAAALMAQLTPQPNQMTGAIDMDALPRITTLLRGLLQPKPRWLESIHTHSFSQVEVAVQ